MQKYYQDVVRTRISVSQCKECEHFIYSQLFPSCALQILQTLSEDECIIIKQHLEYDKINMYILNVSKAGRSLG